MAAVTWHCVHCQYTFDLIDQPPLSELGRRNCYYHPGPAAGSIDNTCRMCGIDPTVPDLPQSLLIGCCPADHCPPLWWELAQQDPHMRIPVCDSLWPNRLSASLTGESLLDSKALDALFARLPRSFWRQVNTRIRRQTCWQEREVPDARLKLGRQKIADQERERIKRQAKWSSGGPSLTWMPYQLPPEMDPSLLVSNWNEQTPLNAMQAAEQMERILMYYFTQSTVQGAFHALSAFPKQQEVLGKEFQDVSIQWRGYPVVPLKTEVDGQKAADVNTWKWMNQEPAGTTHRYAHVNVY